MKVIDCVIFSDEIALLKKRLEYYDDKVDQFVVCEADKNFYGEDRELVFPTIRDELKNKDKITYLVKSDFKHVPKGIEYAWPKGPWVNEWQLREHLNTFIADQNDNDIIIVSDTDEFYDKQFIYDHGKPVTFMMTNNYFYVNYVDSKTTIPGPQLFTKKNYYDFVGTEFEYYSAHLHSVQGMRNSPMSGFKKIVYGAAWHFSYLGGLPSIRKKLNNFSHSELMDYQNKPDEYFLDKISKFEDIFDRQATYEIKDNLTQELKELFNTPEYYYSV